MEHQKVKGVLDKKEEPKSKMIGVAENINEINIKELKNKKSNSFHFLNKKIKEEILLEKSEKNKSNLKKNNDNKMKINLKKNFVLKSEIYKKNTGNIRLKLESNEGKNSNEISKESKAKESINNAQLIRNYFENDKNNILKNIQLSKKNKNIIDNIDKDNNNNNIYITNNIIQNNIIYYFPSSPYYNYPYSENPSLNYVNMAKTQTGSKFLQEKILLDNKFANDILFQEIKNNLKEICTNIFGSSLFRILFKQLRYENLNLFLSLIQNDLHEICLTEPGSHTIQYLIENIHQNPLLLNKFIFYLNNKDIKPILLSAYGSHIFKKYLFFVKKKEYTDFIFNYIYNHFIEIVKGKYGVCIVQKCLSEGDDNAKKTILNLIIDNLDFIMKDNFGNYLIHYIFIKCNDINFNMILPIIQKIEENLVEYCKLKHSASVLEKCFERGNEKISLHFIQYLLDNHSNDIIYITANQFGFFVIKKSLNIKNIEIKKKILNIIERDINKLQNNSKEKKLVFSLLKEFSSFLK